jgi:hypothetical protein
MITALIAGEVISVYETVLKSQKFKNRSRVKEQGRFTIYQF